MLENLNSTAVQATEMLRTRLKDWRDGSDPVWRSTWPVFERLIARQSELAPVWEELAGKKVTGIPLWHLTEQAIFAATEAEKGEHGQIRRDYCELKELNGTISELSIKLAELTERRDALLIRSGHFYIERLLRLTDFIDEAGRDHPLYWSYVKPEMEKLNRFDLKYWPDLPAILKVLGREKTDIGFRYDASAAIACARPSQRTDFLRDLFDRIHELSDGSAFGLAPGFRLTDASLATLCNVLCNLTPENIVDDAYIKQARQRLRKKGYPAVW